MSEHDNQMWDDYNHYMHTGELSEYFEEDCTEYEGQTECANTPNIPDDTFCIADPDVNKKLDDVIRYLKQQIKEKERAIKSQKKKRKK